MRETRPAWPFRLGTTSYIIPDDILPNLRFLRHRVDDVELVLFESDEFSNMPSPDAVAEMRQIGEEAELSFTVHLPLDTRLGSADEGERVASVGKCRRVMDRMAPLAPFAWILHLHGDRRGNPPTDDPKRWIDRNRQSLTDLLATGTPARQVCVETLDYDFEWTNHPHEVRNGDRDLRDVANLVEDFDLSVCLDLGHLLVTGRDVGAHLDRWFDRARVFHVHGVRPDGQDHAHLGFLPAGQLEDLAGRLARLPGGDTRVLTMEVFGQDDFERSMLVVQERLAR
jgi:sugar phosphate isomerase/epimerase